MNRITNLDDFHVGDMIGVDFFNVGKYYVVTVEMAGTPKKTVLKSSTNHKWEVIKEHNKLYIMGITGSNFTPDVVFRNITEELNELRSFT